MECEVWLGTLTPLPETLSLDQLSFDRGGKGSQLQNMLYISAYNFMQELRHISITDIIHEDVPERGNCKKVIIKFIPELPRTWKDNYNKKRKECDFIVSMSDENTTLL